jgi:CubicO group peptidase (beta-lactamase class C family)
MQDQVAAGMRVSNGCFGWNGAFGPKLWVDPKEKRVDILLMLTPNPVIRRDFENAVMQALVE